MKTTLLMCKNIASTPRFVFVEKQERGHEVLAGKTGEKNLSPEEVKKRGEELRFNAENDLLKLTTHAPEKYQEVSISDIDRELRATAELRGDEGVGEELDAKKHDTKIKIARENFKKTTGVAMDHRNAEAITINGYRYAVACDKSPNGKAEKYRIFKIIPRTKVD